jgi:toxin-antitoxin system PIN domain toxin
VIALLDVNVLVALFDAGHSHHQEAHDWFDDNRHHGWASCPITENGMLRILSNPRLADPHLSALELTGLLAGFCQSTDHHFWCDDLSLRDDQLFDAHQIRGHKQLTDVYLLGLAVKNNGRFVTLDTSVPLEAVKGARREHLEVITASA